MITTGKICQINISSSRYSANKYLVELPVFKSPGDLNTQNYIYEANCSTLPGHYDSYNVGDMVYIGFINDSLSTPVILGKIYQGRDDQSRSYINCQNLKVEGDIQLSKNIRIGDISYAQLTAAANREPVYYYNHVVECSIIGHEEFRIKIRFMNRSNYNYSTLGYDATQLLTEVYRVTSGCMMFCDIYRPSEDDETEWIYDTTSLLRLTEESCKNNILDIQSSVLQVEHSQYSIESILTDDVTQI